MPGLFGTSHGALQFMAYEDLKERYNKYRNRVSDTKLVWCLRLKLCCGMSINRSWFHLSGYTAASCAKYWYMNWNAEYIEGNNTFSLFRIKQLVFTVIENQLLILANVLRILEEEMRVFSYFVEPEGVVLNPGKPFGCNLGEGSYFWKNSFSWWEWEGTTCFTVNYS